LKDGSNFVNVFNYYKTTDIFFKKAFESKLQELMPVDLTDITFEFDKFVFRVGYNKKQYTLNDLSDGTIKALLLTMLINLPINNSFSLLAIDEPEMNLHPAWQKCIGKWIQTSSNFRQCFISTHSPDFLDVFTEGFKQNLVSIFIFDPKQDEIIKKIEYTQIKESLGEWELGDLYRVNDPAIGGWPW
jgi:predicted ATPase